MQQFYSFDARYQDLVHDLAPPAMATLKKAGLRREFGASGAGPWQHRFMVSCITASIELATLDRSDLNYIPQRAILTRTDAQLRYPVTIENPRTKKPITKNLIPDALFGLEYLKGNTESYWFFILGADRSTEPTRTSNFNRKSHLRTIPQYREYVGQGLYKEHLHPKHQDGSKFILQKNASRSKVAFSCNISTVGHTCRRRMENQDAHIDDVSSEHLAIN